MRASIEFLLAVGITSVAEAVVQLSGLLREGAKAKGYEVLGSADTSAASGIVSVRKPGIESQQIAKQLKDRGMLAATRQGWLRFSPHFYISPDEIERVLAALP